MAAAAFKSSVGDAGSSNRDRNHRRCRSLSRAPVRTDLFSSATRGKFVNTERGAALEFGEVSLDDLANDFFPVRDWDMDLERERERGRSGGRRLSDVSGFAMETASSRSRGRSVSRTRVGPGADAGNKRGHGAGGRASGRDESVVRRRSVSVSARRPFGDHPKTKQGITNHVLRTPSQTDMRATNDSYSSPSSCLTNVTNSSQKDLHQTVDSHSSQSSSLTDDEAQSVQTTKTGSLRETHDVYACKKSDLHTVDGNMRELYKARRKEVRKCAIDEIRKEFEKVKTRPSVVSNGNGVNEEGSDHDKDIARIKRNYAIKLEESEKRRKELLAELEAEEFHGQELTKFIRELLPEKKQNIKQGRASRSRRRSNDRNGISKALSNEAAKHFEDFISNVEDTDLSSFDEEKSETSSTLRGSIKSRELLVLSALAETQDSLKKLTPPTSKNDENDGVVLPWLQWETNGDNISSVSNNNKRGTTASKSINNTNDDAMQEERLSSNISLNSHQLWSGVRRTNSEKRCALFDMSEYISLQENEDLIYETYRQRERIDSGSLIFCGRKFGSYPF